MEREKQESSSLSPQQVFVLSVFVGRSCIVVCFFFTRLDKMLVPQVGVSELCHRFTGRMCAVKGVAADVVSVSAASENRVRQVGPSSLTVCVDKEEVSEYLSYLTS